MGKQFFLLIKKECFDKNGALLTAKESAGLLLSLGYWPLWNRTKCREMVRAGDELLVYLAGDDPGSQSIVARAEIAEIVPWAKKFADTYPLDVDGMPEKVLMLKKIKMLDRPTIVKSLLDTLSFVPANKNRWGVVMMGGMRHINQQDFLLLGGGKA